VLAVESLSVAYGGLTALCEISLAVRAGQFVSIVGPNGAGKTTLFKAISGTVCPSGGCIRFEEQDLLAVAPSQRAHLGIAHVAEGRQVFGSMTVMENLEMGAYPQTGRRDWGRNLDRIFAMFPILAERGMTVVIIEHTMRAMVRVAERLIVLDHGRILAVGKPGEITSEPSVIEAYLGKKWAAIRALD